MTDPNVESPLQIRLFGSFDVRVEGKPLPALRSRKGQWLLALLTLRQGREVARKWLAGILWPDSQEPQSLASLRRTLTDLRQALGAQAARVGSPTPQTLCLDMAGVYADVAEFDTALEEGSETALNRAVAVYRGPFMEGCAEEWVFQEREIRRQAYQTTLENLACRAMERHQPEQAAHYFRLAIGADPLSEPAQRGLMRALAESGSLAAATLAYRDFRLLLHREMNVEPDPETTALFQHLRQSAQAAASQERAAPPAIAAPIPAPEMPRTRLPSPLNSFIGRVEERSRLHALLKTSRLLTLAGAGGCGKTRLALQLAWEIERESEGVACWVDLAAVREPGLVWGALAKALDAGEEAGRSLAETICRALQARRRLLILDNCEHILDAVGEMASVLLKQCAPAQILVTSREPLSLNGEVIWRVVSLSVPKCKQNSEPRSLNPTQPLSELMQYESMRLFAERASSTVPGYELTDRSGSVVAQICCRLDGIPLAIELAAARVSTLTVEQIEARLDDRFRLLQGHRRDLLPHQQTLRALIDWSYDLLTPSECALLKRLSVFAGGWTLEAAEAVCGEERLQPDGRSGLPEKDISLLNPRTPRRVSTPFESWEVLELTMRLVDKSLILFDCEKSTGRYYMLETIREYTLERLREAGEEREARDRHLTYFMAMASEAEGWKTGDVTPAWLDRVETEYDNLRAALQHTDSARRLLSLAEHLFWFWNIRGRWREGSLWLEKALEAYPIQDDSRAKALNRAGIMAWRQGDCKRAKQALEEGVEIYRRLDDPTGGASLLGNMGLVLCDMGDYPASYACHEQSLQLCREQGDRASIAARLSNLGLVTMYQERYAEARAFLEEAIALYRSLGHKRGMAIALANRGVVALREKDYSAGILFSEESVSVCQELAFKGTQALSLNVLGILHSQRQEYAAARRCYNEGLQIRHEIADRKGISDSLSCIADWLLVQGKYLQAARLTGVSDRLQEEVGTAIAPVEQQDYEANLKLLTDRLGADIFQQAWKEGQNWPLETAIEVALREE